VQFENGLDFFGRQVFSILIAVDFFIKKLLSTLNVLFF